MTIDVNPTGLQAVLIENRERLIRFLRAHGAGDAAEDLLHDLWLRVGHERIGPVAQPLSYLYRAANNLMIDRVRARRQAERREQDWVEVTGAEDRGRSEAPEVDRMLTGRQALAGAEAVLTGLGERAAAIFRRHRVDGIPQAEIARELGVSLSTVESDLRRAYRAMIDYRRTIDEG